MLLAFCHWLWEVDVETGECKLFFNKEGEKLDTVKRAVRVVSNEDWSGTNALIAINI
ncbi:17692_t:CDS:2 [Entrophospora sp. SA101]|nr:17692_t:CDS:2 [Entrophospora sp. SA101]